MQRALALALVLQCCDICVPIRVPVAWDSDSEVTQTVSDEPKTSADKAQPQSVHQPVPVDYFQYTAKKPQFAVDIAEFHGVQSPEEHYKAYPVQPQTGLLKPQLGKHRIQDPNRPVFQEFQKYINKDGELNSHVKPISTNYEIFHPYKAEEAGFQELYKDPILDKIRNDIRDSSQRLQTYEDDAGKPNIQSGEYLESLDESNRKKTPQRNVPARYEEHRPQRRPVYYRPAPKYPNRNQILNQRFRHPWNQNFVKIRPAHYVPLQNHLYRLRQNHALKYDDERNEYPQVPVQEHYEQPPEGYDIYEKGKAKFVQLRNNLDESINDIVKENRPSAPQKLELQPNEQPKSDEEDEFVPIKNYAQVRKTETTKHLPKSAALNDAETYEEIKNAPRLREAIKSTKAQTVYTEEGYEDSAYDHAGEQKHASDHEAHAGYLKEKEKSGGKYKIPSVSGSYEDGKGSAYRDQTLHGKKWKDDDKDSNKEEESEDYAEDEHEQYVEADAFQHGPANKETNQRNKREDPSSSEELSGEKDDKIEEINDKKKTKIKDEGDEKHTEINESNATQHDVNKRETSDFKVPDVKIDSIFSADKEILEIAKDKIISKENLEEKYPYYFKNLKAVNEHSPLRYAENLKFIPKKSRGGTEFYDSRSQLECPEVGDDVDAIPEKLKKNGHPDEDEEESSEEVVDRTQSKKGESGPVAPRLSGLGDKIDCFKAKYFGENPLDSPFFKEELISNPEPIKLPNSSIFKFKDTKNTPILNIAPTNAIFSTEKLRNHSQSDIFELLSKLHNNKNELIDSVVKGAEELRTSVSSPLNLTFEADSLVKPQLYGREDKTQTMKYNLNLPSSDNNFPKLNDNSQLILIDKISQSQIASKNISEFDAKNSTEPPKIRRKRASPFVYEPYKIIKDVQTPDSKKTTTTSNISPLIKQLQSSKVIDTVVKDQSAKPSTNSRTYKDIGRKEREKKRDPADDSNTTFIDVNVDKRRGEPRYELRPTNHKSQYTPVKNKKTMTVEDYENQIKRKQSIKNQNDSSDNSFPQNSQPQRPMLRAIYNNSRFLPKFEEIQKSAASNTIKTTVATTTTPITHKSPQSDEENDDSEEDYDEEYDDEEEDQERHTDTTTTSTTTTTSPKPFFKRRIRSTTTTTEKEEEVTEEPLKLRLVTRFRSTSLPPEKNTQTTEYSPVTTKMDDNEEIPKYREKKKKSTKRTFVTDTKKYGDENDDDMREEEIDALIGIKHDMNEYMPTYEKEIEGKNKKVEQTNSNEENDDDSEEEDYDEDSDDEYEDDDDDDGDDDQEEENSKTASEPPLATTEIPKRTLARTTDAPPSTTETRSAKLEVKPVVMKKKIEIHKELPVNKSSPHLTQYTQDIKEEVVIKELPMKALEKKQHKNLELLDLYKDENLAKNINQLGGVEIFKEDLDLKNGPKHGGNYRRAPDLVEEPETTTINPPRRTKSKAPNDAVAVQTENKKRIELQDVPSRRLHGGNLKSLNSFERSKGVAKSEKLIELTTETINTRAMHGGNLRSARNRGGKRFNDKSAKLIELDEGNDNDDDNGSSYPMHGGNFKSFGSRNSGRGSKLHGGNYKNAKLVADENQKGETKTLAERSKERNVSKSARVNAAILLNSFAQAAPILTSTPAYIVDPSKRMYYYVD